MSQGTQQGISGHDSRRQQLFGQRSCHSWQWDLGRPRFHRSSRQSRDKSWKGDKSCLQMHCCTWRNLEVISQGDLRLDGHEAFCRPLHGPNDVAMLELARGERHQGSQGRRPLELKVSGVIIKLEVPGVLRWGGLQGVVADVSGSTAALRCVHEVAQACHCGAPGTRHSSGRREHASPHLMRLAFLRLAEEHA